MKFGIFGLTLVILMGAFPSSDGWTSESFYQPSRYTADERYGHSCLSFDFFKFELKGKYGSRMENKLEIFEGHVKAIQDELNQGVYPPSKLGFHCSVMSSVSEWIDGNYTNFIFLPIDVQEEEKTGANIKQIEDYKRMNSVLNKVLPTFTKHMISLSDLDFKLCNVPYENLNEAKKAVDSFAKAFPKMKRELEEVVTKITETPSCR